ncbi:MAG: hypothetical protein J0L75_18485 [Spirochaetes bacterium]|nr:hypothetical protein [Spirochaetota bacterium]
MSAFRKRAGSARRRPPVARKGSPFSGPAGHLALLLALLLAGPLFPLTNDTRWIPLDGSPATASPADPSVRFAAEQRRIDFENRKNFQCALFGGGNREWSGKVLFPLPNLEVKVWRNDRSVRTNIPLTDVKEINFRGWKHKVMDGPKYAFVAGETEIVAWSGRQWILREPADMLSRVWIEMEGAQKGKGKFLYTWYVDYLVKGAWLNSKATNNRRFSPEPPDEVVRRIVFQDEPRR